MSRISKRLPLAALVVAMVALFVALGANAVGAGGGGKSEPRGPAQAARSAALVTVFSGTFGVSPGTQRVGLTVLCPLSYPQVTGGGVFSSGGPATSVNTSIPYVTRVAGRTRQGWRIDYNNLSSGFISVRVYARCLRNV